jgi:thioredoxin 1
MADIAEIHDDSFAAEVLQSAEPVLVDFWAPWCAPCKALVPVLQRTVEEHSDLVRVVKVNTDDHGDLAERYDVTGLPTMLLFVGGDVVARYVGPRSYRKLEGELHDALR